jgi:hypothetical protein
MFYQINNRTLVRLNIKLKIAIPKIFIKNDTSELCYPGDDF